MINSNGELLSEETNFINHKNRGLRYGDSLFETIRVVNSMVFFWEEHYRRLMASMRILRMEIPMAFTMDFLKEELLKTIQANFLENKAARIRLTVFRNNGGLYLPITNDISYCIESQSLELPFYALNDNSYEVGLYKDFYVNPDMISTLKTNNKIINVVGSIFAKENGYDNCLLLNYDKKVVEALNGNLFLINGNTVITPPLNDGCLNGIIRKKLLAIIDKIENYSLKEASISPFDLQKADELFITNSIVGICSISKYRKKQFGNMVAKDLIGKLNATARFSIPEL